ncbi:MAG: hypothetical protein LKI53_04760 [Bacteroidales bacterium]|jgi:hypothetical protein|nr:hypothetical protein [Bacteroidales bacterium]
MTTEEKQIKRRILIRLSKGYTTIDELKSLCKLYKKKYTESGKSIDSFIEWPSFNELLRRLTTSVFSEAGKSYPLGYKKYCIYEEYHNTKLFIELTKKLITIGLEYGDITKPDFYGQPDPGFTVNLETLIHILLRHNDTINSFLNPYSKNNGHNPSSFGFGAFADPMLTLLMALNAIDDNDWKTPERGKNLICHFTVGGQKYTIVRKGHSKEIKSIYPRNDDLNTDFIELDRNPDKMEFYKKNLR